MEEVSLKLYSILGQGAYFAARDLADNHSGPL